MIAYNRDAMHNFQLQRAAAGWLKSGIIDIVQRDRLAETYPNPLTRMTFFLRIVLFLATAFACSSAFGTFSLSFGFWQNRFAAAVMLLLYGAVLMTLLDRVVIAKFRHFRSGVDDAGLYAALVFWFAGAIMLFAATEVRPPVAVSLLGAAGIFLLSAFRWLDRPTLIAGYACLIAALFQALLSLGGIMQSLLPFVTMLVAGGLYWLIQSAQRRDSADVWSEHFTLLQYLALLTFYLGGNYFVVRELSIELLKLELAPGEDIPLAWLFWLLTFAIPVAFLYLGTRRRDVILIHVGLFAIAGAIATLRYYEIIISDAWLLTGIGAGVLAVATLLSRRLRRNGGSFTAKPLFSDPEAWSHFEAAALAETAAPDAAGGEDEFTFGGGKSGGAGASGKF